MLFLYEYWLHFAAFYLSFVAFCLAFCCISPCVLVQNALRFDAKCTAFWCILRCVLPQNALQKLAIKPRFLVVADANLGEFFFKEKCKSIVNGQKTRGQALKNRSNFIVWAHFI
jgi:hypothetical protein